ncbi:antitoxin [Streptomyces sp. JNUCC 64]
MSILDTLKAKLAPAKGKVSDLARQHGEKIDHGLDKAARLVDDKTKGKYSDKIHSGADKAKGALDKLAAQSAAPDTATAGDSAHGTPGAPGTPPGGDGTPPPGPGAPGGGAPGGAAPPAA